MARYVVVGLGSSGLSAVRFLVAQGHQVGVTDGADAPTLAQYLPPSVKVSFGQIDGEFLTQADRIVISPGIDPRLPQIAEAMKTGIPVVSDIQLFVEELARLEREKGVCIPVVAITGSNAKSTVTTLVGDMAKRAGKVVGVGGNIGTPALDLLAIDGLELVVLELSSFQLECVTGLGASVATILNLSADHLDRHGDMDAYLAQKLRIFDEAKKVVICLDDDDLTDKCRTLLDDAQILTTSGQIGATCCADFCLTVQDGVMYLCHQGEHLLRADALHIKGKHNLQNALSALALGATVGLPMSAMLLALQDFRGLAHRCEFVKTISGKDYFNDSKGTNVGSTLAAIDGLGVVYGDRSLALILGGLGKGQDFTPLAQKVAQFACEVYLIGQDATLIGQQLLVMPELAERMVYASTLAKAVELACVGKSKAVLLSPACASFDQFASYSDRGEQFVAMVMAL